MAGKINKGKVIAAAQKYVQKGQYDKAIREYTKIVDEDPRDVRIWLKIGDLYAKKGASDAAVDTYLKVAEFYSEQGFYLKAVAVYKQILKLNPTLMDVNLRLAEFYKQLGFLNDAMRQYELVSGHFLKAGRTKDALVALKQIVDLDPENVASRIKLAELYSKEQMREEAIEEFSKAADFLRANNRIDDFIKVAERLAYHQPDNIGITKELASLYLRRGDPRRALPRLQTAFKADPRAEDTLEMLAQAFRDLGQVSKTVSVWKELAQIHFENGQPAKQQEIFRRILELVPDDADVRKALQAVQAPAVSPPDPRGAPPPASAAVVAPPPAQPYVDRQGRGEAHAYVDDRRGAAGAYPPSFSASSVSSPVDARGGVERRQDRGESRTWAASEPPQASSRPPRRAWGGAAPEQRKPSDPRGAGVSVPGDAFVEKEFAYDATTAPSDVEYDYGGAPASPQAVNVESLEDEVARVLTEADVYIKYGLHDKAIEHLRQIFLRDPNNVDVRLQLKDLHTQLGRYGEAALELYTIARHIVGFDPRRAAQYLNEALELDSQNNAARQLLREIEGGGAAPAASSSSGFSGRAAAASGAGASDFDESDAIDLDIDDIVEEIPIDSSDVLEDPFGDVPSVTSPRSAGRRYASTDPGASYGAGGSGIIEVRGETIDTLGQGTPAAEVISLPADASGLSDVQARMQAEEEATTSSLEDDLEEADFFIQQSLFSEARTILDELLARYPGHPLVEGKLAELDAFAAGEDPLAGGVTDHGDSLASLAGELDDVLGDELDATQAGPPSISYSVEEVFDDIKRSVGEQVSDEDSDTHYDLGIAYREMGLFDDAIAEFKVAMRSREKEVLCHMMIGLCHSEKGLVSEAISQFKTGLYVEGITERETIALYFELAQAYEKLKDHEEALYYYEKVYKKDPHFRDVDHHVLRLRDEIEEKGNRSPSRGGGAGSRTLPDETDVAKGF